MIAPWFCQLARAMAWRAEDGKLTVDFGGHGAGEGFVVGDENALGRFVVLGLREQVGGDPGRVVRLVGDDQNLGRACDRVDADLAEDLALGGGDIGVAGADDLVDGGDRLRAVSERRDRLRAADAVDFV